MPEPPAADAAGVSDQAIAQAVAWYVRMSSGEATDTERQRFARWLQARAEHARAWERLQAIQGRLQGTAAHVAPGAARAALARAASSAPSRRHAVKALAWAGAGASALYLAGRHTPLQGTLQAAMADVRTAVGEHRRLRLADGTQLLLNTDTAVDVRFDDRHRQVRLLRGEILVETGQDAQGRPLLVETADGQARPVGTRFTVQRLPQGPALTRVAVSEGAVRLLPREAPEAAAPVRAGQQAWFSRTQTGPVTPLAEGAQAWAQGVLTAEATPLGDFIADLSRYRVGRLRCAPEVAHLRITGVWPLAGADPTTEVLASLQRQLPVRIHSHTRYWVTVVAR